MGTSHGQAMAKPQPGYTNLSKQTRKLVHQSVQLPDRLEGRMAKPLNINLEVVFPGLPIGVVELNSMGFGTLAAIVILGLTGIRRVGGTTAMAGHDERNHKQGRDCAMQGASRGSGCCPQVGHVCAQGRFVFVSGRNR